MKTILCFLLLLSPLALAGGEDDPLALLQGMAGDWQLTFLQIDDSGEYRTVGTSKSQIQVKLGGKLIQEETLIRTARNQFPLLVSYSYDSVRGVYRKASTDGVTGLMDIQEGFMQDGVLHLSNTKYQTWFVNGSGPPVAFRIAFDLNRAERPVMTADLSTDHGQTWQKFQRVIYERAPARAARTP